MTIKELRKAIKALPDDAEVELSVTDPPDGVDYQIDGIEAFGDRLVISISESEGDEWEDE